MKTIEEIWEILYCEREKRVSEEEKKVLHQLIEKEKEMYSQMNEEMSKIFGEYNNLENELCALSEKESFCMGVKFGVKFMVETMLL